MKPNDDKSSAVEEIQRLVSLLDKGLLSDPTGALRYPPRRVGAGE